MARCSGPARQQGAAAGAGEALARKARMVAALASLEKTKSTDSFEIDSFTVATPLRFFPYFPCE
ncbi:hypothetical protein GQ55_4G010200 [Panicum hallii var. hallii]|uniref:Uncharacterized protein n=1 Tax=Panicum hallii var. hallii TaxID=1504633 RepID=A0A2T7DTZ6_9POAL|nr:hypothetical protein GQ55_4G010200 [Panicum hallii var. hallii]